MPQGAMNTGAIWLFIIWSFSEMAQLAVSNGGDTVGMAGASIIRLLVVIFLLAERQRLLKRAASDSITGLKNKAETERLIDRALKKSGAEFALVLLDIDGLKSINDTYGHPVGDEVILAVAESLKSCFDQGTILGRVGGDEFVAFIRLKNGEDAVKCCVQGVVDCLKRKNYSVGILPGISVGMAKAEGRGMNFVSMYRRADREMYCTKREKAGSVGA